MNRKRISIDNIGFSNRVLNALHRSGIFTVEEMLELTEESLSQIRNLGRKSIDEILEKIEEYKRFDSEASGGGQEANGVEQELTGEKQRVTETLEIYEDLQESTEGRKIILSWLGERKVSIRVLDLLPARIINLLLVNHYAYLDQIIFLSADEFLFLPGVDSDMAADIVRSCSMYLKEHETDIQHAIKNKREKTLQRKKEPSVISFYEREDLEKCRKYVKANDRKLEDLGLSVRTQNGLRKNRLFMISDIIFLTESEIRAIKGFGNTSVREVQELIENYFLKNENRIEAFLNGDESAIMSKESLQEVIQKTFNRIGFGGLSLRELREEAQIPPAVSDEIVKSVLGNLIAEGCLEYVDYRCYRLYPKYKDYLLSCPGLGDRDRDIIVRRLKGETLESIASVYGMTRERIRQITKNQISKIIRQFRTETGLQYFDEDYYRYFYETYEVDKKEAGKWLGIDTEVFNYLEMTGSKKGEKELQEAVDDYHNLDYGFRLKIKSYLNRNRIFADGRWIEKKRPELEEFVVRKYCRNTVSFMEFCRLYNEFLQEQGVEYDEDIYYTEALERSRKNRLADARFLLWKFGEQFRFYDMEGQDFTELWDTLNLEAYENIEYSTEKFMLEHPDIMKKYDIRDQYELHNLMRKTIPEGSYHGFHCNKMPMVEFGTFDRDSALLDLLIDNAPISQREFADIVHREYGYEPLTVIGTYLQPLDSYYHQGMYTINQKVMALDRQTALLEKLDGDFYYIDEIRKLYLSEVPGANPEEINPYNLKSMGFQVLSRYVLRNYSSLEAYFTELLTKEDITDITIYRKRFAYVQSFSGTLINLKNRMEILEFEPNRILHIRKLETAGITKVDLRAFCDEVYDFVETGKYFSVRSIKKEGFDSELFELGFSDWFYSSLLTADSRFASSPMFGNIILFKGNERITIKSFEETLIKEQGSIYVYDLMNMMESTYGCRISDRLDLVYRIQGTNIYYENYSDKLYADIGVLDRELDETERS